MTSPSIARIIIAAILLTLGSAATGLAQTGAIVGTVTDSSGAVLPGVTVEASSPALIERVRTTVGDAEGKYRIIDLRTGVYAVSFSLPGFSTVKRDNIELTAGFTATVNGELRIGAIEETVTVSGQTPLVDVQNVTQHKVITQDLIDRLPTGRTFQNLTVLIPGVNVTGGAGINGNADVGGSVGERNVKIVIHGSQAFDMPLVYDGMPYNQTNVSSGLSVFMINTGNVQEITVDAGGLSAEADTSGVRTNIIPKQGGNSFSGYFLGNYTNDNLQSINISEEQRRAGFTSQTATVRIWDVNPAGGGPIRRDRLWFYSAFRYWGNSERPPGAYYDTDPLDFRFTPDLTRPVINDNWNRSTNLRLTWQMAARHKVSVFGDNQQRCTCANGVSAATAWEASQVFTPTPDFLTQATWNWIASNKVLVEGGFTSFQAGWRYANQASVGNDVYSVRDLGTGITFRAPSGTSRVVLPARNTKTSVSYVTGRHTLKVGLQTMWGWKRSQSFVNNDTTLQLLNGVPTQVTVFNTPSLTKVNVKMKAGVYAQDQWTINRLTLNLGVRFDTIDAYVPEQDLPAVRYVGPRSYPRVGDAPSWRDVVPRAGVAWDLFGNGRTAIKVQTGKYLEGLTTGVADAVNPAAASVTNATRSWRDANGDFIPQESELGPLSNNRFGQSVIRSRYDPDLVTGYGKRMWNGEAAIGIQHELMPGLVSIETSYHRRWYGNFRVTDNLEVTPADYDTFCITSPVDSRLPDGGGEQICGLADVTPAKFGLVNGLVQLSDNFGKSMQQYGGVDVAASLRLPNGARLQGGFNSGRTTTNQCFVIDSPAELRFCDVNPKILTQVKLLGVYPLPWAGLLLSGTFQSVPGPEILANYAAPNARVAPSLGRNLAGGAGSTSVQLIEPGTRYGDRLNQIDTRIAKEFRVGKLRLEGQFDVYNLTNANPVLAQNNTYGAAWLQPTAILPGRTVKFGVQVDY
jgi:outer membrane receptor protein involved in Fe transport